MSTEGRRAKSAAREARPAFVTRDARPTERQGRAPRFVLDLSASAGEPCHPPELGEIILSASGPRMKVLEVGRSHVRLRDVERPKAGDWLVKRGALRPMALA
jgi:hypothetical protein